MEKHPKVQREKGFTLLEVILTIMVVSITSSVLFLMVSNTNRVDTLAKENKLTENLLEPYLSYYQNSEVTQSNYNVYLSDLADVDLAKFARQQSVKEKGSTTNLSTRYRDLHIVCNNTPTLFTNSDGKANYIEFSISCEKNEQKINKGKSFVIKKYINP